MNKPEKLPKHEQFLDVTEPARRAIEKIGNTKPQGSFRISCNPTSKNTEIEFAWDDVYSQDDFMLDIEDLKYEIVMDALSIAYILDEYQLSHDGYRFILSKHPQGPKRHR